MIGIIVPAVKGFNPPPNLDDYFDPTTHIASEEDFIAFLEQEYYTEDIIGYKVQLSNSTTTSGYYDYNGGTQIIIDVNHDSENTGQTNCYDLISEYCFHSCTDSYQDLSTPRGQLNNTFYDGFNTAFKNHMIQLKYKSDNTQYTTDYITIPSVKELTGLLPTYAADEGVEYSFLTNQTNRSKYYYYRNNPYTTTTSQFTRTTYTYKANQIQYVGQNGSLAQASMSNGKYLAPIIRVS